MRTEELREMWRERREVALFDAREEGPFAEAHPFFAVSLPSSRVETSVFSLVPRRNAPVVVYDAGEGLAEETAAGLRNLGYSNVSVLEGGLATYARTGEVFRDVNVPSKAFGELVESTCHTPSLSATEVKTFIDRGADLAVLDVRRFSEYATMNIPSSVSVPGGEIALRVRDLAPSPETLVVVNCAGRTRSIIGTQTLVNAGIPNRVAALRNGTMGWTLEGFALEYGQSRQFSPVTTSALEAARASAARLAAKAGVGIIGRETLLQWRREASVRTLYCLDVRTQQEYQTGHPVGFTWAEGGQLVQATDEWIAVRGARIVLYDDDDVRARMTASWLAQMGWDVVVLEANAVIASERGMPVPPRPPDPEPDAEPIRAEDLALTMDAVVVDLATSPVYQRGHIPGARFLLRSRFAHDFVNLPGTGRLVLTSPDGVLANYAAPGLEQAAKRPVVVLAGGTEAWIRAGYPMEDDRHHYASDANDVYKRPYEGVHSAPKAMRAYIDWELQLVDQMGRDDISNFKIVI